MTTIEDIKPYQAIKVRREGERNARHIMVESVDRMRHQGDTEVTVYGYRVNADGRKMHSRGDWARTYFIKLADIVSA